MMNKKGRSAKRRTSSTPAHLKQLVQKSREQINHYMLGDKPEIAFPHFLVVFTINPNARDESDLKELFLSVLCSSGESLEKEGRYKDLVKTYEQALDIYPGNADILTNLGTHALRFGDAASACTYYRRALEADADFLPARRNLQHACNSVVERWHFSMLNDNKRNEAFSRAISRRIQQGFNRVLDIGCGTGILSLFAARSGAKEVYACDYSKAMANIAADVFAANRVMAAPTLQSFGLLRKSSYEIDIPDDIPERVSLVVTETFDAGVFGENVLQTLLHAWDNLLVPSSEGSAKQATVIPQGVTVYVAGISCDHVARKSRLAACGSSRESRLYDCEDLSRVPGGFETLAPQQVAVTVDFGSRDDVWRELAGSATHVTLRCCSAGRLDAIAAWFRLHLDGKEEIFTGPDEGGCWDQAIFHVSPRQLSVGERIHLDVTCEGGKLDVKMSEQEDDGDPQLSEAVVRFMNDAPHVAAMLRAAADLSTVASRRFLDFSPWPLLGSELSDATLCCVRDGPCAILDRRVEGDIVDVEADDVIEQQPFDVIVMEMVDSCGELNVLAMNRLPMLAHLLTPTGVLLPRRLTLCCAVVESDWLERVSTVIDDESATASGFDIARHINVYQSSIQLDFYLPTTNPKYLTEPLELLDLSTSEPPADLVTKTVSVPATATGRATAVPYWFRIHWLDDSEPVTTMHEASHINQAAYLVNPPLILTEGEFVDVTVKYLKGVVTLGLERQEA